MGNSATYFKEVFQADDHSPTNLAVLDVADPRSPTTEFTRTPIGVGLPIKCSKRRSRTISGLALECGSMESGTYIRSSDADVSDDLHEFAVQFQKMRILHSDPRSPTVGIARTPIQVPTSPGKDSHDFSDSLIKSNDDSADSNVFSSTESKIMKSVVSLMDPRSPTEELSRTPIQVPVWTDVETENMSSTVQNITPSERKENKDVLAKKLFGTPDWKNSPKVRTPLATVSANANSPHQILRAKQSRGINLELGRRIGIENTPPPCLNKYDLAVTQVKHNTSSQWSQDSTFVI